MRLLIAGSHGQVARSFLGLTPGAPSVEACAIGRPGLDICQIRTIERALADINPTVVINTAAYTAVDDAEGDAARALALNADGAGLLAEAAARRGVPIIHLSTDYVFDGQKSAPYVEDDATNPLSVYGRTKLAGEAAVAAANPRHIILRTAWVYSPFGKNFVKTVLARAEAGSDLRVVGDQVGSPTYAPHLVAAILRVAERLDAGAEGGPWGIYHAAGSGTASWFDVAHEILDVSKQLGGPTSGLTVITSDGYPTRAVRPKNSRLDCSRLDATFGVSLPDWRIGVRQCVERLLAK